MAVAAVLVLAAAAAAYWIPAPPPPHYAVPTPKPKPPPKPPRRGPKTFYVARWGSNANPGTRRKPWRTVSHVNRARLRPGDTVLFRAGEAFTDATLMPGRGSPPSGTARQPITFGSWGRGRATLTRGIWLGTNASPLGASYIHVERLALGPRHGFEGTGSHIELINLKVSDLPHSVGIETEGSHWLIVGNHVSYTGDSGMLLGFRANVSSDPPGGSDYLIADNVITDTGTNPGFTYGTHGLYVKVANAKIIDNRITHFRDDGISVRYRNATVLDNYIADGSVGIAWFQYGTRPGTSTFAGNTIVRMSAAGIFVCGTAEGCRTPIETFLIHGNRLRGTRGTLFNLQPTDGVYRLWRNRDMSASWWITSR